MYLAKTFILVVLVSVMTTLLPILAVAETGAVLAVGDEHCRSWWGCVDIPDNGGWEGRVNRNCDITGAPAGAVITKVVVKYDINHTYVGDLIVQITTERNSIWYDYTLWDREGGSSNDIHETDTVWSKFDGLDPNGTWYLVAWDNATEDVGCIDDFEIWVHWETDDPKPDLIVQDIWLDPYDACAFESVTIKTRLKNQGAGSAGGFYLKYYVDSSYIGQDYVSSLGSGSTADENISYTEYDPGWHNIEVFVDSDYDVSETNEGNNRRDEDFDWTDCRPDLIVEDIWTEPDSPCAGAQTTICVKTKNIGLRSCGKFYIQYYVNGSAVGTDDVYFGLDPGETDTECITVTFGSPGTVELKACADYTGIINEKNESNNCRTESKYINGLDITVQVQDQNGASRSGATVIRYKNPGTWQYVDEKTTDGSGRAWWSDVNPGMEWCFEAYYNGEFWGGVCVFEPSCTHVYPIIRRHTPYAYQFKVYDMTTGTEVTGGTVPLGTPLEARVWVTNDGDEALTSRVNLWLDRDQSAPYDFYDQKGSTIGAHSTHTYIFTLGLSEAGTYFRRLTVDTWINSNYALTDSWAWGQAITIDCDPPPTPGWCTASDDRCESIEICWENVSGETGYRIYMFGVWGPIGDVGANQTCFTYNTTGTHEFWVRSYNSCDESGDSPAAEGTGVTVPGQPSISGPSEVCGGQSETYTATSSGTVSSWGWSSNCGGSFSPPNGNPTQWTPPTGYTGSCQISVTANNICGPSVPGSMPVSVIQEPGIPTIAGPDEVCGGGSYQYSATASGDPTGWSWNSSCGGSFSPPNGNPTNWTPPTGHTGSCQISVTANNICGSSTPGSKPVNVRQEPGTPPYVSPPDGATDQVEPMYLDWSSVNGADMYQVQVDTNQSFSNPLIDEQPVSSNYNTSGLPYGWWLYWRVRAYNECGWGAWNSPERRFVLRCPGYIPIPDHSLLPPDGATGPDIITFSWDEPVLAYAYILQVACSGCSFENPSSLCLDITVDHPPVTCTLDVPEFTPLCWRVASLIPPECPGGGETGFTSPAHYLEVEDIPSSSLPSQSSLQQNYPNPFNMETRIQFALPRASQVTMDIYNVLGKRIRRLVNERLSAGHKLVTWDGRDERGNTVSSGIYFYRMVAGDFADTKKLVLLK